jgi:hypothetical protein
MSEKDSAGKGERIMAMYRKLGKKTKLRKALLRSQVTALIFTGAGSSPPKPGPRKSRSSWNP